jgi:hypothetical protein
MSNLVHIEPDGLAKTLPVEVNVEILAVQAGGAAGAVTSGSVVYQFEQHVIADADKDFFLSTHKTYGPCTRSTGDGSEVLTDAFRRQIGNISNSQYRYDLRSLFYCLGDLTGMTVCDIPWPTAKSDVRFMSMYATSIDEHNLVFYPGGGKSKDIIYTIAVCAKMAQTNNIYLAAEQGGPSNPPEDSVQKRRFIHRTMRCLMRDVIDMDVYGEHMFAYYRGLCKHITLRAHSDEGGWIRKAMMRANYPRPVGLICQDSSLDVETPRFKTINTSQAIFLSEVLGHMVETAACVADADPLMIRNMVSVFDNRELDDSGAAIDEDTTKAEKPSAFPDLEEVLNNIEDRATVVLGRTDVGQGLEHHTSLLIRGTFRSYLSDNRVDKHFKHKNFMPYAYVEHGAVLKEQSTVTCDGPKAGRSVQIPLFPEPPVTLGKQVLNLAGNGHALNDALYFRYRDTGLRGLGAFYLGSGAFGGIGLESISIMDGVSGKHQVAMCRDNQPNLESMRWIRPHCPVPMAGESSIWSGRPYLKMIRNSRSKIAVGLDYNVTLTVGSPIIKKVDQFTAVTSQTRRNVVHAWRKALNQTDLEDDEVAITELYSLGPDTYNRMETSTRNTTSSTVLPSTEATNEAVGVDHAPPRLTTNSGQHHDDAATPTDNDADEGVVGEA